MNNQDITDINKKKISFTPPLFSFVKRKQNLFSPLCLPAMSRARERNQHSFWSTMSSPGNSEHSEYLKTNPKLSCDFHLLFLGNPLTFPQGLQCAKPPSTPTPAVPHGPYTWLPTASLHASPSWVPPALFSGSYPALSH